MLSPCLFNVYVECYCYSVTKLCPTLCNPVDSSLPGSSVHGILQQEYWSGLPFPSPGDLPDPGIEPVSSTVAGIFFTTEPPGKSHVQNTSHEMARLDESQAGIKIAGKKINILRYADDTTLMAESEEQKKSLLMKVKEEHEKAGLMLNIQKTKIMASIPSLHGR